MTDTRPTPSHPPGGGALPPERSDGARAPEGDLAALVAHAPVAICRVDGDGRVTLWNPGAEDLFGWRAEDVLGAPLPIVPPAGVEAFDQFRVTTLAGHSRQGLPAVCVHRDGELVDVRVWASAVAGPDGRGTELVGLIVAATDEDQHRRTSEQRWRRMVRNVSDAVAVLDADGVVLSSAGALEPILGYPNTTWVGQALTDLLHPDDVDAARSFLAGVVAEPGSHATAEIRARHHDGTWVEIWVNAINLLDDPSLQGVVMTTHDISDRRRAERLVASQTEILELIARGAALDDILEAIALTIEDNDQGSQAAVLILEGDRLRPRARTGRGPSPALRSALSDVEITPAMQETLARAHGVPVVLPDVAGEESTPLRRQMAAEGLGAMWWAPVQSRTQPHPVGVVMAFHAAPHAPSAHARRAADVACTLVAIALEHHTTVAELAHRSLHDDLTGLPNRTLLLDRLQIGIDRVQRVGGELGVLYVDIDRFKMVNDSFGHAVGDGVLTTVADRLRAVTRPGDTIARVGADEFVILCDRPGSLATILSVADRLTEALREPFTVETGDVYLTASLGLAMSSAGTDGPALLRKADTAMFRAKQRGRNRLEMYDSAMQANAHDRLSLGSDLRRAVSRGELRVVYQPIVALSTGAVVGAEALCRWNHPTRGDVPPAVFIPVAEETGTVSEIGAWVLETALGELADLTDPDRAPFVLSVNLSPRQLDEPDLVGRVTAALRTHGWPAEQLCLELTETALTEDLDIALGVLTRLRATGVRIAVDDFGTGYSSLTHLQRLPIDSIKIDRSFVSGLGDSSASTDRSTITAAVLGIAQAMGLDAVAEGVETRAELQALRELGCQLGQGYLFSVPVPAEALERLAATPV